LNGLLGVDQTENLRPHAHTMRPHLCPDGVCFDLEAQVVGVVECFVDFLLRMLRVHAALPG
jgi:hypothetical protein